jgi:hypothetical protein
MSFPFAFVVWAVIAASMTANGIFRELVLRPTLGATLAGVASAALGIAIILGITHHYARRFLVLPMASLVRLAITWLVLTVVFECAVGLYVDHKSWSELLENYALWRGNLWPIVLASMALAPFIWGRWLRPDRV